MKEKTTRHSKLEILLISLLFVLSCLWLLFGLFSGTDDGTGGFMGNIANALVWLLPLGLAYVTWHWQLVGSLGIILFGLGTILFFGTFDSIISFSLISFPFLVIGGVLLIQELTVKIIQRNNSGYSKYY